MARRQENINLFDELYEMLLVVPSWSGPLLALLALFVFAVVVPDVCANADGTGLGPLLAGLSRSLALPAAGLVMLIWLLAEFQKWQRRRLLDSQSGLDSIRDMSWQEFEHIVGEAYRRQGYIVEETGNSSGDGGIDLLMRRGDERVLVQCKQWRTRRVGVKPIRELFGVITSESATRGILVAYGSFTREARLFAEGKPLDLVGGPELWELIRSVKTTKSTSDLQHGQTVVEAGTPKPTRPPQPSHNAPPQCPKCNAPMVLRTAKRGANAGSQFWGCSNYPPCRGIREYTDK